VAGLYAHFPWCVRKCPYCDFNSHRAPRELPQRQYVDALLRDLDFETGAHQWPPVDSVFLGGGTPSLFDAAEIGRFLEGVAERLVLAADCEITLEANPGTVEAARFRGYRDAGINRLSLGVQSFSDAHLAAIGRIHDGTAAEAAARAALSVFDNVNLDLMYGLPRQDISGALEDLHTALALDPPHLSLYQLTLEENTPFFRDPPPLPGDDARWEMGEALADAAGAAGYEHYEVSAWGRPRRHCRHNVNYWHFGDYVGIGAGAHGKLSVAGGGVLRRARVRHPATWMQAAGSPAAIAEARDVPDVELPLEFLMNRLRLAAPLPLADFETRTGLPADVLDAGIAAARARDLLGGDDHSIWLTERGRRFLNDVLLLF